jgi:hypothetical protein
MQEDPRGSGRTEGLDEPPREPARHDAGAHAPDRDAPPAGERDVAPRKEPVETTDREVYHEDRGRDVVVDRAHQREEFGGFNIGAAFFGWLVAVGIAALLVALVSAAGGAIGLTEISEGEAQANAETISIAGGIALLVILAIAYFAGGYVAGRLSRFDGGRQGLGVWVIALTVAVVLAVLGAVAGSEYNVLAGLDLPRIPIDEGTLTTGALITLLAALALTALAAIAGGKAGERYHRRVDAAGLHHDRADHRA